MYQKNIWTMRAALVLLLIALPVQASDWLAYSYSPNENMTSWQPGLSKIEGRIGTLQCADKLIGATIKNNNGQTIGTIKELILSHDMVFYVVLSSKNTLHPVPWSAFDVGKENFYLNISPDRFREAPGMNSVDHQQLGSNDFRTKVENYYSEQISSAQKQGPVERAASWMKGKMEGAIGSSENPEIYESPSAIGVIGLEVRDLTDQKIANVEDVIFDVRQGNLTYCLVRFGGLWGLGAKTAAVPWSSLRIDTSRRIARLDANRITLEACVIEKDHLDALATPEFASQIYEFFGDRPYWEVYGFVPPEKTELSSDAWKPGSDYNKNFNADKIVTIEGAIASVGTFTPEKDAEPGLLLTVKVQDESYTVHTGPRLFMMQKGVEFKVDSSITVTGSKTAFEGNPVIMACEIKIDGKTIAIRDKLGKPLWPVEEVKQQATQAAPRVESQSQEEQLPDAFYFY